MIHCWFTIGLRRLPWSRQVCWSRAQVGNGEGYMPWATGEGCEHHSFLNFFFKSWYTVGDFLISHHCRREGSNWGMMWFFHHFHRVRGRGGHMAWRWQQPISLVWGSHVWPMGAHQRRSLLSELIWRPFLTTVTSLYTSFGDPALCGRPT